MCFLTLLGVPLSEATTTRAEPNKSAIDLAVKALRDKERQHKWVYSFSVIRRPESSSVVAYKPKEEHKKIHDVVVAGWGDA